MQGLWYDDPSILMLPGLDREAALPLASRGLAELPALAEALHCQPKETLQLLTELLASHSAAKECAKVGCLLESLRWPLAKLPNVNCQRLLQIC